MMGEIGLHRYNAIHRIKEHKEQFNPQAVPDLYHVAEYYKAVGVELTCCCLQAYGKDFIFTQDEVKEIIEKEGKTVKSESKRPYRENSQQVLEAVLDMLRIDMQNTIEGKDVAEPMVHYPMSNEEIKHESEKLLEWIKSRWEIDENGNLIKKD